MDQVFHMWKSGHLFWPWCSCNIDGTYRRTEDFHFFDITSQTFCVAFLLNFWTLQRSFCISKLHFDTSILYPFRIFKISVGRKGKSYYKCSIGKEVIAIFEYVIGCHSMWEHITKIVFGCGNFPSNSSVQQNYPSVYLWQKPS